MSEISSIQIELPLVALRGLTVMPDMIIHFDLSRDFSKAAVEHAMTESKASHSTGGVSECAQNCSIRGYSESY